MTNRLPEKQAGAVNDMSIAVEFLMGAIRDLVCGANVEDPGVQEQINWSIRKIILLDNSFPYGAQSKRSS